MYAIIKDGGHQYRVETGQRLKVQLRDVEAGSTIRFENVCLLGGEGASRVGKPFVAGASVEAKVVTALVRAKKVVILKYRRRKNSVRRNCHRQNYTEIQVTAING